MNIVSLLDDKSIKPVEKRKEIAESIRKKLITIKEIQKLKNALDDKKMALVLEAMEDVSSKNPEISNKDWLKFTQEFIASKSNNIKREASRIIGNTAHLFPNDLDAVIKDIMKNTKDEGTVIRWSCAYAFARIIQIPKYADSKFFDVLTELCVKEKENGVKNQLLNGLKKAKKLRGNK
ncbi:MAG: hypothetical protein FWF00_00435 [Endomicrobia bacterium]|nr:hypothetical protein [Endomicrobiia bacterium]MCL2506145.1 hypothetical protein [Endomicrobiia bacterium]